MSRVSVDGQWNPAEHGFAVISGVYSAEEAGAIANQLEPIPGAGLRCAPNSWVVREIACARRVIELVRPHLAGPPTAVRAICFDKTPSTNWLVPWHQDITIAVRERVEVPGFGPWSVKEGVHHVHPPARLLEQMITLRLHLDDTHAGNGALRVIPGSHAKGKLSPADIAGEVSRNGECICEVAAGGVVLMRPLLLHASSRSHCGGHRRVVHIEYAGFELPEGLGWVVA